MLEPRIPLSAAVLILTSMMAASAASIPRNSLFERDSAQCLANYELCSAASGLPDNFCCATDSTCIPLAGNTTIVCCPPDSDCGLIEPIACQLDLQDASLHADAVFKTTALNGQLPHCGNGTCCPFGYSCNSDQQCEMNANQNPKPAETVPAQSSTSTPSTSPTRTADATTTTSIQVIPATSSAASSSTRSTSAGGAGAAATTTPSTAPTATPVEDTDSGGTPTAVIAGAAVGAVLLLAATSFIAWVFFKRRTGKLEHDVDPLKLTRSTSSFGNIISNPIVPENSTMRTDFVRKSPGRSSTGSVRSLGIDSVVGASGPLTPPRPSREGVSATGAPRIPPIRGMAHARQSSTSYGGFTAGSPSSSSSAKTPRTPQTPREPSSVSINIFADPVTVGSPPERAREKDAGGGRFSTQTTFSEMLQRADLGGVARGEPFVPRTPGKMGTPGSKLR